MVLHITPTERAALRMLAGGKSAREIARELRISEDTVEAHLTALCTRLGAASRTEAVEAAWRRGLLGCEREVAREPERAHPAGRSRAALAAV